MFVTLMYHLVDDTIEDSIALSRRAFGEQMQFLQNEGYRSLTIEEASAIAQNAVPAPPRAVLITFDDGYNDNVTHALPILARHGLCATNFVISAYIGRTNRWNPKACYDAYHLDWAGLRTWLAAGCDIGGHSHEHLCLTRLSEAEVRQAVRTNKELLEGELGRQLVAFSYPYGMYNALAKQIVAEAYAIAFSDTAGTWSPGTDRHAINRIGVRPEWHIQEFARRLAGAARWAAQPGAPG